MFFSQKRTIKKALDREINRAKRFRYFVGILIVDVSEMTPRGVHRFLPGVTVSVRHIRSLLRNYDVVMRTKLRRYTVILPHLEASESARVVRNRILLTARLQDWDSVNVGVAIFPEHGTSSSDLIKAAEYDLQNHLKTAVEPDLSLVG
ncbi:MAG: diguanylate cyclase [bacterium]